MISPNEAAMRLCTDGEIVDAGRVEMEIVHGAFRFLIPQDANEQETVK